MPEASDLIALIESAFAPLYCVAELRDYRLTTWLRVYDPDGKPLLTAKVGKTRELLENRHQLIFALEPCRARVEELGFALAAWPTSGE